MRPTYAHSRRKADRHRPDDDILIRWRRSWYDVGRPRYAHADQLTLWVRSSRRYLSWPNKYRRRSLPIPSSCPSIPWIQCTVPCNWFIFLNSLSFSSNRLPWHYYSDGGASLADLIALSAKQIEQIISRTDKKIALLSEQFGASSVE